ncbi:MAG TPA: hypothetical protein VK983_00675 [Candidatus Limnocylindrales bacterium]|nr:hypothetical protein [Candidatus Limnocylindrales bacterium]
MASGKDIAEYFGKNAAEVLMDSPTGACPVMFENPVTTTTWQEAVKGAIDETLVEPYHGHEKYKTTEDGSTFPYNNVAHHQVRTPFHDEHRDTKGVNIYDIPAVPAVGAGSPQFNDSADIYSPRVTEHRIVILPLDDEGHIITPTPNPNPERPRGIKGLFSGAHALPAYDERPVYGALAVSTSADGPMCQETYSLNMPGEVPYHHPDTLSELRSAIIRKALDVEP